MVCFCISGLHGTALKWLFTAWNSRVQYMELYLKPPATAENCWKLTASKIELGISRDKAWTCMELPETVYRKPFTPRTVGNDGREKYPKNFHTLHFFMKLTHPWTFFRIWIRDFAEIFDFFKKLIFVDPACLKTLWNWFWLPGILVIRVEWFSTFFGVFSSIP